MFGRGGLLGTAIDNVGAGRAGKVADAIQSLSKKVDAGIKLVRGSGKVTVDPKMEPVVRQLINEVRNLNSTFRETSANLKAMAQKGMADMPQIEAEMGRVATGIDELAAKIDGVLSSVDSP